MAINPRIIIILAQFPPINGQDWLGTLDGHKTNYSDRFVLPVFVTTICVIMRVVLLRLSGRSTSSRHLSTHAHWFACFQPGLNHNTRINHGLVLTRVFSILVPQADSSINTSGAGSTHICLWMQHERIGVLITVVLEVSPLDYNNLDTRRSYTSILVPSIYKYLCTSLHVLYFASTSAIATTVGPRKWKH